MATYETLPYLPLLSTADMADADHLRFTPRTTGDGYEKAYRLPNYGGQLG